VCKLENPFVKVGRASLVLAQVLIVCVAERCGPMSSWLLFVVKVCCPTVAQALQAKVRLVGSRVFLEHILVIE
jgi:hypothetical protein